jgi:hypothetical protein
MMLHTMIQVMKYQYSPVYFAYNQAVSLQVNQYICQQDGQRGSYSTRKSIGFKNHDTIHVVKSVGKSIKSR